MAAASKKAIDEFVAGYKANANGQHEAAPEPWEPPSPIDTLPEPMPFPLEAFPAALANYVHQCAWATNSQPDFVAVPLLAIAAGCLGASRALAITRDHIQPATIFSVVVGLPGTGKTPAIERVSEPLERAEARFRKDWKRDLKLWQDSEGEEDGERVPKPTLKRLMVDDTTMEPLIRNLEKNRRGLVMVRDELRALVAGFNQYRDGKGNDRQNLLRLWSASAIRVDRSKHEDLVPVVIRRPSLSITGGLQPAVVPTLLDDTKGDGRALDDGLLDRFLWSYPARLQDIEEQWREVEPKVEAVWFDCAQWLLSIEQGKDADGEPVPILSRLSGCGREAWVDFTRGHAEQLNDPDFPDHLRGPWSKLRGYCARLALVLRFVAAAIDGEGGPIEVDGLAMLRAAELIRYFKAHWLRVSAGMGAEPRIWDANRVLSYLIRHPEITEFSRRDIHRHLHATFKTPEALDAPLSMLVQHGYLRLAASDNSIGRKATQKYEVNPLWGRKSDKSDEPAPSE